MANLYQRHIQRAIDCMERRLDEEIDLSDCARASGYSMYHFTHIFALATGMTPMLYLRRRRITEAVRLMARGAPIVTAAQRCGFQSAEVFLRAFKAEHGVLPSAFLRAGNSLRLCERLDLIENQNAIARMNLKPEVIELPPFGLRGLPFYGRSDDAGREIPRFWNAYNTQRMGERISDEDPRCRVDTGLRRDEGDRLVYWIGVRRPAGEPCDLSFPGGRYAVFDTPRADQLTFVQTIHAAWDFIYARWFPESGFIHGPGPSFESYCEQSRTFSERITISIGAITDETKA